MGNHLFPSLAWYLVPMSPSNDVSPDISAAKVSRSPPVITRRMSSAKSRIPKRWTRLRATFRNAFTQASFQRGGAPNPKGRNKYTLRKSAA